MGNVMTYSGIVTKVRAMSAKLLTNKDYDNISNLGSVPEAIEYLKGWMYLCITGEMWKKYCISLCLTIIPESTDLQG